MFILSVQFFALHADSIIQTYNKIQNFHMKDFLKYTLATITGIIIAAAGITLIGLIALVGIIASKQSQPVVNENSVLCISLSGVMDERSQDDVIGQITGQTGNAIGLDDVLSGIRKAKDNDNIKGIYIEAGLFSPDSPASAQAIRKQLEDFKKSGKWVVAYADRYSQLSYYICSAADKVFLNPQGMVDWHGLSAQPMYLKDLLAKFGVKVQLSKVGKYKSAPEMFTADHMSDPNREQVKAYLDGTWNTMLADVSKSRKLSTQQLNAYADSMAALADPADYLKMHLVDKLLYTDQVKDQIKQMLGISKSQSINQISLAEIKNLPETGNDKGGEVAVYYAYGDVVDTNIGGISANACIAGDDVCKDLERLADDDDVKAVVLRVNSGGGSAYASEQIWHAVKELKARKPVVVSMGGMAASGAYYLSSAANYIYAEPTTLTGSIGIFGMFPDFSGLLTDKLGIKFDEVKTNRNSAFGTMARPFNAEEMNYLNAYIERGYKLFLSRVAEGRKMSVAQVNEIAQGRVWLGADAKKINLIDGFGGIYDAIAKAASMAKISEYHTKAYPAKATWMEQLMNASTGNGNYLDEQMQNSLGEYYEPLIFLKNINRHNAIQARLPYVLNLR